MKRVAEPELMDSPEQVQAYARADFADAHDRFVSLFSECYGTQTVKGYVLDLGCGPGDVIIRMAKAFNDIVIHGVDGGENMLNEGRSIIAKDEQIKDRIELFYGMIPDQVQLPRNSYDFIISNSLLHHLQNVDSLWTSIKRFSNKDTRVFVMDLKRPQSIEEAENLVKQYAATEPDVLREDFYHSLLAAFTVKEVRDQLNRNGLMHYEVKEVSDRHLIVYQR